MPEQKQRDAELGQIWSERIEKADRYYKEWETKFKCNQSEEYYEGFQWRETGNYSPYVINLVFSTIEVQRPTLVFQKPAFSITAKPGKLAWDEATAAKQAAIQSDVLNNYAMAEENEFADEIEQAIIDSYFRFGLVEVGFSTDWIDNPNADKPILRSDSQPMKAQDGTVLREPAKLPEIEWNYVKRIDPKNFRIGGIDNYKMKRCNWVGYFEFVREEDLKANSSLKNTENIGNLQSRSADFVPSEDKNQPVQGDVLKVWRIWDLRAKKRLLLSDSHGIIFQEKDFKRLPLFPLKFYERRRGFYPVPPVFNWLSPQNEINEGREGMRTHRRRFQRKFFYDSGKISNAPQIDKMENGPDGTFIGVDGDPSTVCAPLQNADLGASASQSMVVSKDDFNIISGTSSEQRGEADRTTATQATIISNRTQIRDKRATLVVAAWLKAIGREVLLQMKENNVLPYWIQKSEGPGVEQDPVWQKIILAELADIDFELNIDITSISPLASDEKKKGFLEFLAVLTNYPMVSMSPELVQETADILGYRNQKVLGQFMQMAQLQMLGKIAEGQAALQQAGALPQRTVAQATPPRGEQITNQLKNQVGLYPNGGVQ